MFIFETEILEQLALSLLSGEAGEANLIDVLLEDKVKHIGKNLIKEIIKETPFGEFLEAKEEFKVAAERLKSVIESRGKSEFNRARKIWLNSIRLKSPPGLKSGTNLFNKIKKILQDDADEVVRDGQVKITHDGGDWLWSKSREEWLNEGWKHDWRSQPRDAHGRWMPGRLQSVYVSKIFRKRRAARRRFIRKSVKQLLREKFESNE